MAMNHLIATDQIHVKELGTMIDYSSQDSGSIFSVVCYMHYINYYLYFIKNY
jgi:hypothetical protein